MKLLFCATDAGGARNLLPVARLARSAHNVRFLYGPTTEGMVRGAGLAAELPSFGDASGAAGYLDRNLPDAILLGTTGWPTFEAWLTLAARGRVPTIAVLDEWYNYRLRFSHGAIGLPHLTDQICCQDDLAFREALVEGLPESRLRVTGSPALSELADTIEQMVGTPPSRPSIFSKIPRPIVVFLSETHAADYGQAPGRHGRIGPFIGYDEAVVRNLLAARLTANGCSVSVVERLHPSDQDERPAPSDGPHLTWHTNREHSPLWPSLWHADAVIGMRSMALLEAALMGHRPAALQPGLIGPDLCTAGRLGLAEPLEGSEALDRWITNNLLGGPNSRLPPQRPGFAARDAAARVLAIAENSANARVLA